LELAVVVEQLRTQLMALAVHQVATRYLPQSLLLAVVVVVVMVLTLEHQV
jgi:hypothetical protein